MAAVAIVLVMAMTVSGLLVAGGADARTVDGHSPTAAGHSRAAAPPKLTNGCRMGARGLPACGAYFGAAVGSKNSARAFEMRLRTRLAVHRTYFGPGGVGSAVRTARRDLARGRLPWISFKVPYSWDRMAAGAGDAWAAAIARRLGRLHGPVWVAFHHEPEGDGVIRDWTAMRERLAPLVRSRARNVAYTVILTGWHQFYGNRQSYGLGRIWPRTKVDVAGFDLYNYYGVPGKTRTHPTNMRHEYFNRISRWAIRHHVRWGVAETGYTDATARIQPAWLARTYRALVAKGGVAMSYFNSAPSHASGDWVIRTNARLSAFADVLKLSPRIPT